MRFALQLDFCPLQQALPQGIHLYCSDFTMPLMPMSMR